MINIKQVPIERKENEPFCVTKDRSKEKQIIHIKKQTRKEQRKNGHHKMQQAKWTAERSVQCWHKT